MGKILPKQDLVTHNYVVIATEALAHGRLGARAARTLLRDVVPALKVVWVGAELQNAAVGHLQALRRRGR